MLTPCACSGPSLIAKGPPPSQRLSGMAVLRRRFMAGPVFHWATVGTDGHRARLRAVLDCSDLIGHRDAWALRPSSQGLLATPLARSPRPLPSWVVSRFGGV
eukprot:554889-Hanusia_phi.AAC.21